MQSTDNFLTSNCIICGRLQGARQGKKAKLERDAAEKKVDILQKALRHHPQSPEILLHLIQAAQAFQEDDEIRKRWQACLFAGLVNSENGTKKRACFLLKHAGTCRHSAHDP